MKIKAQNVHSPTHLCPPRVAGEDLRTGLERSAAVERLERFEHLHLSKEDTSDCNR